MNLNKKTIKLSKPKNHTHSTQTSFKNITLDKLRVKERAIIKTVGGSGPLRRNLLDMGLTPNTEVMIRKVAPMGDPLEINLRGYELTIRKSDAREIIVEVLRNECGNCNQCSAYRQS